MTPQRAIQQLQLGKVCRNEQQARQTLTRVVAAGFEGIELNGFMVRPTPLLVRGLTRLAGMPTGNAGRLDWASLVEEAGLRVVGLHEDLGSVEADPEAIIASAAKFKTCHVVIPGMFRFNYTDPAAIQDLARRLNTAGNRLAEAGLNLLYHNHNAEFRRLSDGGTPYETLIDQTDPALVGFEFDAYWPTAAGADPVHWAERLGKRLTMMHITDRGTRKRGSSLTPIDKADAVELGVGTMDISKLIEVARSAAAVAVILETHRNWVEGSPLISMERSAVVLRNQLPKDEA